MPTKSSSSALQAKVSKLAAENERLKAQNAALKAATPAKRVRAKKDRRVWYKVGIVAALGLAGALLVAGNILFWTGRSLVDNQRFMATAGPLIQQPAVQQAVASYATDQLYQTVDVEQFTADALPPRAAFLAPTLNAQIKTYTEKTIQGLLANEKFQNIWNNSLDTAHSKIIAYATNYQGDGTISLNDLYQGISKELANTNLSFLANRNLPDKVGSITVVQVSWLPTLHRVITHIDLWRNLAVLAVLLLTIAAIMLARNRRRMVISVGLFYAFLMAATLLSLAIAQTIGVDKVAPAYQAAAKESAVVILKSLRMQTYLIMVIGILMAFIAWATGPYKTSRTAQGWIEDLLAGKVHAKLFKQENMVTEWIGRYKPILQWTVLGLVGLTVVFVRNLTPLRLLVSVLVVAVIDLIIEIVGAPQE